MDSFLLLTRAGSEGDCAAELAERAGRLGLPGYARAEDGQGWLRWECPGGGASALLRPMPVFARTAWSVRADLALPERDRVTVVLDKLDPACRYGRLYLEYPDTNDGRGLQRFLRGFRPALEKALKARGQLDSRAAETLHLFFPHSRRAALGESDSGSEATAAWENGIPRLRLAREAPSRSALKLEEGLLRLLAPSEREYWLRAGRSAADLGAAPGGWSWLLARKGLRVTAVDHGALDEALLRDYPVEHVRADAFTWRAGGGLDWVVCDVVDKPARTLSLMEIWLREGRARLALFNLKLPMKKRWPFVSEALERLRGALPDHSVRAAQLYHDRDEVTLAVVPEAGR